MCTSSGRYARFTIFDTVEARCSVGEVRLSPDDILGYGIIGYPTTDDSSSYRNRLQIVIMEMTAMISVSCMYEYINYLTIHKINNEVVILCQLLR